MSRSTITLLTSVLACVCLSAFVGNVNGQEQVTGELPKLTELVDRIIDVRLNDGRLIGNAKVITATEGKLDESLKAIKVQTRNSKKLTNLAASKIQEIYVNEMPLDVDYDKKNRCIVHSLEKKVDRREHRRIVEERLSANRKRFWKPITEDDHKRFMQTHRAFLKKTESTMSHVRFRLVETDYFLFLTDLPPAEVDGYIVYLDAMYRELCKAFGLSPDKNIWCGKCVVVAFGRRQDFLQFEAKLMNNNNAADAQGLCHQSSDGTVIFAGYKGDNGFFGHVLVHETSHGFVHRYLSSARAPSWLNEGMADWLANVIVKGDQIPRRQKTSALIVKQQNGWGDFLSAKQIDGDYYGTASTLVEILLSLDKGGQFNRFFIGIKEGKTADESLKDNFGISYQDLTILYARAIANVSN